MPVSQFFPLCICEWKKDDLLRQKREEVILLKVINKQKTIMSSILSTSPNDMSIGKKQFHRAKREPFQMGHSGKSSDLTARTYASSAEALQGVGCRLCRKEVSFSQQYLNK